MSKSVFFWLNVFLLMIGETAIAAPVNIASPAPQKIITRQSLSLIGPVKYADDFSHFAYANPNAPKGGTLKLASLGTFDSLNPYATKGKVPEYLFMQYDRLMARSQDEPFSVYPLVADSLEHPEDMSWVAFNLNSAARFHDGKPVTSEDILFTVETLKKNSSPFFKRFYQIISHFKTSGPYRIEFQLSENYRSLKTIGLIAHLPVLPKHFWEGKDFYRSQLTIPLGSGPMRVARVDPGHSITYERVRDYWAKDLPVNKGQFNFDKIRIDYYRDNNAALEAFAAGAYDIRIEPDPRNWHQKYNFPAIKKGDIVKDRITLAYPKGMAALTFNTRRHPFNDRNVRLALNYLFNFEWTNEHLLHSEYLRANSFYINTPLASSGLPEGEELKLLSQYKDQLPSELFTRPTVQPVSNKSGNNRDNQKVALDLLKKAGWQFRNGKMTEIKTGKPMEFEILLSSPVTERIFIPYANNLSKLGIKAEIETVESNRFRKRARHFDFDVVEWHFWLSAFPGVEQTHSWSSAAADEKDSNNIAGVKHPVIDALLARTGNISDYEQLIPIFRSIDRILLWENYVIPTWHKNDLNIAYRNHLNHPRQGNLNWFNVSTWWHKDAENKGIDALRRLGGTK